MHGHAEALAHRGVGIHLRRAGERYDGEARAVGSHVARVVAEDRLRPRPRLAPRVARGGRVHLVGEPDLAAHRSVTMASDRVESNT